MISQRIRERQRLRIGLVMKAYMKVNFLRVLKLRLRVQGSTLIRGMTMFQH